MLFKLYLLWFDLKESRMLLSLLLCLAILAILTVFAVIKVLVVLLVVECYLDFRDVSGGALLRTRLTVGILEDSLLVLYV